MNSFIDNQVIDFLVLLTGAICGSFISLLSYRLPLDLDIIVKRSNCITCHHPLGVKDLFPIFSWLASLGKCNYCAAKISFRYPLIEILSAIVTYLVYKNFGITVSGAIYLLLTLVLLTLIIIDFEHYIIPDSLQIILAIIALFRAYYLNIPFGDIFLGALLAASTGLIMKYGFILIRKKDGLGMGDIKFMVVVGLFLGVTPLPIFFFISGVIGVITAIIWRMLNKGIIFPFGPAIALAMMVCLLVPHIESKFSNSLYNFTTSLSVR
jgi:leader peptidase (prepilin peptidase)/N-methyltransferase